MNPRPLRPVLLFWAVAHASPLLLADVTLAPLFTDHAVLQRDRPVPVWGRADPGEAITLTFAGQTARTVADDQGKWSVTLDALPASATGRALTVTGKNTVTLSDLLVGDVWLCGGQSNMEWPLANTDGASAEIAAATYPEIRHIKIERAISAWPVETARGVWTVCSPETAAHYTAVGYYFARDIHREIGVPIGLVNSNWGGTPVEAWLPAAAARDPRVDLLAASHQLAAAQSIKDNLQRHVDQLAAWRSARDAAHAAGRPFESPRPAAPWTPGPSNTSYGLNHAMIAPLAPAALRGVIWYQGEANADQPETYHELFSALIRGWREQFAAPDLPFYWVQLANWNAGNPQGTGWARLREAQTQTLALPHTGQAVIYDIGDVEDIHPRNKRDVGARLARIALADTYGRDVVASGPTLDRVSFDGATATVSFEHAHGLRTTDSAAPLAFELAGRDGVFHPAAASLNADAGTVTLRADAVPTPTQVRYAWRNTTPVNLVNAAGLPAAPFRTDSQ